MKKFLLFLVLVFLIFGCTQRESDAVAEQFDQAGLSIFQDFMDYGFSGGKVIVSGDQIPFSSITGHPYIPDELDIDENATSIFHELFPTSFDENFSNKNFIELNDTPSSYAGEAGKFLKVSIDENRLIFVPEPGGSGGRIYVGLTPVSVDSDKNIVALNVTPGSDWNGLFDGNDSTFYIDWTNSVNRLVSLLTWDDNSNLDAGYVNVPGDTMTGNLNVPNLVSTNDINALKINTPDLNAQDATTTVKGISSFFPNHFSVSSGAVSILTDGIDDTLIDWGLGANQISALDIPIADANDFFNHADTENVLQEIGDLVKNGIRDPTGFPLKNETPITITFTDGTRTLSVSPSGTDFNFFIKGKQYIKTAEETLVATDDEGAHYFYYDSTGALAENVTPTAEEIEDIIRNNPQVAVIYWNTTDNNVIYFTGVNELHGTQMDGDTHEYLHFTRGSIFLSGFAVGDITVDNGGNVDGDAQLSVADGRFEDEDIEMEITDGSPQTLSVPAEIPIFYKSGSSLWKKVDATTFAISTTGSGRAAYNLNTAGTWSLVEVSNNKFTLSHIFATNNSIEPIVIIMGENEYGSKVDARLGAITELNDITTSGLGFQEFVPIATVIFQTNNTYSNTVKSQIVSTDVGDDYVDWRFQEFSPSVTPRSHSVLADLLVDSHPQYVKTDGTRELSADWFTGPFGIDVPDLNVGNEITSNGVSFPFDDLNAWVGSICFGDLNSVWSTSGCVNISGYDSGGGSPGGVEGLFGGLYIDVNGQTGDINISFNPTIFLNTENAWTARQDFSLGANIGDIDGVAITNPAFIESKVDSDSIVSTILMMTGRGGAVGGVGLGSAITTQLENSAGVQHDAVKQEFVWSDPTDTTEDANYSLSVMTGGVFDEKVRHSADTTTFYNNVGFDGNVGIKENERFCLDWPVCTKYLTYDGTATIIQG